MNSTLVGIQKNKIVVRKHKQGEDLTKKSESPNLQDFKSNIYDSMQLYLCCDRLQGE